MTRGGVIMTAGALSMGFTLLCVVNVGYWLSAPRSAPEHGDLIVALGGGGIERLQSALTLYQGGYAKRILLTGVDVAQGENDSGYRHWHSQFLLSRGVPPEALLFDAVSGNSYAEANNTAALMKSRGWSSVLVVSDPPHLQRLAMVWGSACARHGLEYRLIATEPPTWDASRWWHDTVWAKFVGMEVLKLAYYTIVY
jgi:uncharacterized SAM-binding protein YcdF (DUF218 family)